MPGAAPRPHTSDVHSRYGCRARAGEKTKASVRVETAREARRRWIRDVRAVR